MDEGERSKKLRVGNAGAFMDEGSVDCVPLGGLSLKEDNHGECERKEEHLPDHRLLLCGGELGLEPNLSDLVHRMMNSMG